MTDTMTLTCAVPVEAMPEALPARIPQLPLESGENYRFHFDMTKCIGCHCCEVACAEQNNNPPDVQWRRVGEVEGGAYPHTIRAYVSMGCNHCLEPACLTGCPVDAYHKEGTGIVLLREDQCIGCQYCTWNCPYGVPKYNEDRKIVTKCDMCRSRLSEGQEPACVGSCPTGAITIETVRPEGWKRNPEAGDAPGIPPVEGTLSTTRFTLLDHLPDPAVTTGYYQVKPEKAHPSLIILTLLTQMSIGGFVTFWLADWFSRGRALSAAVHDAVALGAVFSIGVGWLALGASVFHLGRPLYAYRALKMWRRSWLSREVLLFTLFALAAMVYSLLWGVELMPGQIAWPGFADGAYRLAWGGLVAVIGAAGLVASAYIYMVPARPAWNTPRTPVSFLTTAAVLGPLFALAAYTISLWHIPPDDWNAILGAVNPALRLILLFIGAAAFFQLLNQVQMLFYLAGEQNPELHATTRLLTVNFKGHFLVRLGLLVAGAVVLPWVGYEMAVNPATSWGGFMAVIGLAFFLALAGEILGRYLFFVTVVPRNMPGNFFRTE